MAENDLIEQIRALEQSALKTLDEAQSKESLEEWRISYIGRKGALTSILRQLPSLSPDCLLYTSPSQRDQRGSGKAGCG